MNSGIGLCVNRRMTPLTRFLLLKMPARVCVYLCSTTADFRLFSQNHLYVGHSWEDLFDGSTFVYLWSWKRTNKAAHVSISLRLAPPSGHLVGCCLIPVSDWTHRVSQIKLNLASPSNQNKQGFITKGQHSSKNLLKSFKVYCKLTLFVDI